MTALDWVLVAVWAGIALAGFFKGAVKIVFGIGGLACGGWLAVVVGHDLAGVLSGALNQRWLAVVLGYLVPFVVVSVLCLLAGWGIERALDGLKLGCLNRGLGMVLAGGLAAVVLTLLLVTAVRMSPRLAVFEEKSPLLGRLEAVLDLVIPSDEPEPRRPDSQETEPARADPATAADDEEDAAASGESSGR